MKFNKRPIFIKEVDESQGFTHFAFFDENGTSNYKKVVKCIQNGNEIPEDDKHFALTYILIKKNDLTSISTYISDFKNRWWPPEGCYQNKKNQSVKVCLHSSDIRYNRYPFDQSFIHDYDTFFTELTELMKKLPILIRTSYINKEKMVKLYSSPYDPYEISMNFLLERLVNYDTPESSKIMLIFEARDPDLDRSMIEAINKFFIIGSDFVSKHHLNNKIDAIHFNPKRPFDDLTKSYFGLEIADLCSYPIYKYCKFGSKGIEFDTVISKMPPYGIKKFP